MFKRSKAVQHDDLAADEGVTPDQESAYMAAASNWQQDRVTRAERTARWQRWAIGGLSVLVACLTGALLMLLPLQRVEPFMVRVDSSTGIVDTVVSLKNAQREYQEEETRYFVRKYVNLRETYTRNEIERAFRKMAVMTAEPLRLALKKEFAFATPTSLFQRLGERGTRAITIKNISRVTPSVLQVRFFATETMAGIEKVTHYVSTIEYEYTDVPKTEAARAVTPLGFTVTAYRRVIEAVQSAQRQ